MADDLDKLLADLNQEAPRTDAEASLASLLATLQPAAPTAAPAAAPSRAPAAATRRATRQSVIRPSAQAQPAQGPAAAAPAAAPATPQLSGGIAVDAGALAGNGTCAQCAKPIFGPVLQALDRTYHIEHFRCVVCAKALNTEPYVPHEGEPYCPPCFKQAGSKTCAACGLAVDRESLITAMAKAFHAACLVCVQCSCVIADAGDSFVELSGSAMCNACYDALAARACAQCSQPITDSAIEVGTSLFHLGCFRCATCNKQLASGDGGNASFIELDGQRFCLEHSPAGGGGGSHVCQACQQRISGDMAMVGTFCYHATCFCCSRCHTQLAGKSFVYERDSTRPICTTCQPPQ